MKRKSLSKKVRFEVFKRDRFTCQYCGASAPDVVLHADHVRPVVAGGSNDVENLVTACEDCNGGKGARSLADAGHSPFAERIAASKVVGLLRERQPLARCYWCGDAIRRREHGVLEFCDQERAPFFAKPLVRFLPNGEREEVGATSFPGTGRGRVATGEWSDSGIEAHLVHESCGPEDAYGYRIGFTRIGSPESVIDWRRQIGSKRWFRLWLCDDIDAAAAASRACDARKAVGF